jgi:hypothetical protein
MTTRIVELRRGILKKNDELAAGLRLRFNAAGVLVLKQPSLNAPCANCLHEAFEQRPW